MRVALFRFATVALLVAPALLVWSVWAWNKRRTRRERAAARLRSWQHTAAAFRASGVPVHPDRTILTLSAADDADAVEHLLITARHVRDLERDE